MEGIVMQYHRYWYYQHYIYVYPTYEVFLKTFDI